MVLVCLTSISQAFVYEYKLPIEVTLMHPSFGLDILFMKKEHTALSNYFNNDRMPKELANIVKKK